jgi:hypothetical protein
MNHNWNFADSNAFSFLWLTLFRLAKRIGVSLYEVSAKTGINIEEAFNDLASTMRERLLVNNHGSDSDDSDQLSSAFHVRSFLNDVYHLNLFQVNGVITANNKILGGSSFPNCCGTNSTSPTFV